MFFFRTMHHAKTVPQVSILGHFLFIIFNSSLKQNITFFYNTDDAIMC